MDRYKKTALVLGAGGFIGSHMVKRLRKVDMIGFEKLAAQERAERG